jgi:3-isopropylmalate dehydrogenase
MRNAEPSRRYSPLVGTRSHATGPPYRIGVLPGEGSGPEIVQVALDVLAAVSSVSGLAFEVAVGGSIGLDAEREGGAPLSEPVIRFCEQTFAAGGAILAGPGGGRFVYDLRRRFDLFCKLNPIRPWPELAGAARLRCPAARDVDVLLVRENVEGAYYSEWRVGEGELAQSCTHTERGIRRIVAAAARIARARRGELAVVVKRGGLPALAALWEECSRDVARGHGIACTALDVDLAAYRMVQEPETLDVVVAPNLFADILSDLGGAVAGSRALTYGGSFSPGGDAVYQTNHGSAHDLARTDRANPAGQVLALAMLLRESFGCEGEAARIERALGRVWSAGIRTQDLTEPGARVVGTRELGRCLTEAVLSSDASDAGEILESA